MAAGRGTCAVARGFTLIELVIFIVIVSIMGVALMSAFSTTLRGTPVSGQVTQATQLAQERMELVLAQRRAAGFAAFADPCPGPAACTPPAGYAVAVVIAANWNGDTNYRVITVTVTGTSSATATSIVARY
jgi:type II secretory pathway pseudopilin PulG